MADNETTPPPAEPEHIQLLREAGQHLTDGATKIWKAVGALLVNVGTNVISAADEKAAKKPE